MVDFAAFQPNMQSAINGIRTIQISHKFDPVVNNKLSIAGSKEKKIEGVSNSDYHLNSDNPNKNHNIKTFSDETQYVPQSNSNPTSAK